MEMAVERHRRRVASVVASLAEQNLDALLVTHLPNIRYLSGFTGSIARLVISRAATWLLVDFRYRLQAVREAPHCQIVQTFGVGFEDATLETLVESGARRIGFESGFLSYYDHGRLEVRLPKGIQLIPSGGQVERLRRRKDPVEIAFLREAGRLTATAMAEVLGSLAPGMSEAEVAARLEYRFRTASLEPPAFETLVACGSRAAYLHARPSANPLHARAPILIDAGASWHGYRADMSRTVCLGEPDREFRTIYRAVRGALDLVLSAVRPGAVTGDLDSLARQYLAAQGLGAAFWHPLGHGIGLEVHEEPWIAPGEEDVLETGMAIALEPGVYRTGWGGVRLEETVLVTEDGCEVLTQGAEASNREGVLSLGEVSSNQDPLRRPPRA